MGSPAVDADQQRVPVSKLQDTEGQTMIRGVPPHFLESHGLVSGISSDNKE